MPNLSSSVNWATTPKNASPSTGASAGVVTACSGASATVARFADAWLTPWSVTVTLVGSEKLACSAYVWLPTTLNLLPYTRTMVPLAPAAVVVWPSPQPMVAVYFVVVPSEPGSVKEATTTLVNGAPSVALTGTAIGVKGASGTVASRLAV